MQHLILLRAICSAVNHDGGVGVSIADMVLATGFSRAKIYRLINDLMASGFVVRVVRGCYQPCDIYQWTMDDFMGFHND